MQSEKRMEHQRGDMAGVRGGDIDGFDNHSDHISGGNLDRVSVK